jgi:hypothetical protein
LALPKGQVSNFQVSLTHEDHRIEMVPLKLPNVCPNEPFFR